MRLLIIDDSRLDRVKIKRLITKIKLEANITEASDAESALAMISVENFDCILIDYHLPDSDGIDLANRITASSGGQRTPMIMVTGMPSSDLAEQAFAAGLSDFLNKNWLSPTHLHQTLSNVMAKQRALAKRLFEPTEKHEGNHGTAYV